MALASAIGALAACDSDGNASSADPGGITRVSADYFAHESGVRVGIRVAFAQDLRVSAARLVWDGGSSDISPYPLDGTDPDVALEFLDLAAGDGVLLEGLVLSACPDPPAAPLVFEVPTVVDGEKVLRRYTPDDPSLFEKAFAEFCEFPVTGRPSLSEVTPEGDITVTLTIVNPGPGTVTSSRR